MSNLTKTIKKTIIFALMGVVNMKIDERIINNYIVELNNIYTSEIKRVENEFKQTKNKSLLEVLYISVDL